MLQLRLAIPPGTHHAERADAKEKGHDRAI